MRRVTMLLLSIVLVCLLGSSALSALPTNASRSLPDAEAAALRGSQPTGGVWCNLYDVKCTGSPSPCPGGTTFCLNKQVGEHCFFANYYLAPEACNSNTSGSVFCGNPMPLTPVVCRLTPECLCELDATGAKVCTDESPDLADCDPVTVDPDCTFEPCPF
jgi:hypothetical protein